VGNERVLSILKTVNPNS